MTVIILLTLGVVGAAAATAILVRRVANSRRVNAWWRERAYFEPTFRQVTAALEQVVWLTTPDKSQTLYVSPAYERVFGRTCASLYAEHHSFLETLHPDDRARVAAARPQQQAGTWDEHYRIVRPDGVVRWIRSRAFPIRNDAGNVWRIAGIAEDVTERREAEAAAAHLVSVLRDLALRDEAVREDERTGIAREIHDELGQGLTGLRIDLAGIARDLPRAPRGLRARIRAMVARLDGTIDSVQRISSELRPSVLDDLGLIAAIEWQAEDFQQRTGVRCQVDLNAQSEIDRPRATAVFRILQEALTNVARHAAAQRVEITLRVARGQIALIVGDDGRGITAAEAASPQALGLVGMRERALAWDGALEVRGEAGRGTTVTLRLPLERRAAAGRVA